mmetsp:Transcript_16794/g.35507  ORF Transcript_16794/g.35507 Transcript_16794/m.35507 type:complete len:325 (+) Transcript_16794:120-1094(+)
MNVPVWLHYLQLSAMAMESSEQQNIPDLDGVIHKYQDYLSIYDGTVKPCHEMENDFEDLFHDDFEHSLDGRPIDKEQMREVMKTFLSIGTSMELILYMPLDECTFEAKLQITNRLGKVQTHSKGTIQEGKLIKFEAYKDAIVTFARAHLYIGLTKVKQNLEYFIERQNDTGVSFDGIGDAFNCLFIDSIAACILGATLNLRGMRTSSRRMPDDFFDTTSSFILRRCEVIDEAHLDIEVEKRAVQKENHKMTRQVWKDVLTVKEACIILIEPYIETKQEVEFGKKRRLISASSSTSHGGTPFCASCFARFNGPCACVMCCLPPSA